MELSVTSDGYVRCVAKEGEHIISEQITAINASNLSLPCMQDRYDSNVLYYHVGDNISVFDYIRSRVMDFELIKELAVGLGNVFIKLEESGLPNNKVITDIRYVFVSPSTRQIKVLQCPVDEYSDNTSYQKIMTTLCYNIKSQNAYVAIGYILEAVKQDNFNIRVFTQRLGMLENAANRSVKETKQVETQIVEKRIVINRTSYILCGIISAIMELVGILLLPYIFYTFVGLKPIVSGGISAVLMVLITMCIFIIMQVASKNKNTQSINTENIGRESHSTEQVARVTRHEDTERSAGTGSVRESDNNAAPGGTTILVEEVEINPLKRMEAYSKNALPTAYLIEEETNRKHQITKNNYLVGRGAECDLEVNSTIVSKKHAEIVYENNMYYVRDLNSKNYTYLNKATIEPEELYKIEDGSRIGFGNKWFIFKTNL